MKIIRNVTNLGSTALSSVRSAEDIADRVMEIAAQVFVEHGDIPVVFVAVLKAQVITLTVKVMSEDEKEKVIVTFRKQAAAPGVLGVGLAMEAIMTPEPGNIPGEPFASHCPAETIMVTGEWKGARPFMIAAETVLTNPPRVIRHPSWRGELGEDAATGGDCFDLMGQFGKKEE
jgi:hypothetical protein